MVISDLCMHGPPIIEPSRSTPEPPGPPHVKALGFRDRPSKDLTFHRYQTRRTIVDDLVLHRVEFLLSRKLKAFGMDEGTRTSLSYVFVDIVRDKVEEGVFDESEESEPIISF